MNELPVGPEFTERGASRHVPYNVDYFNQSLSGCVQAGKVIFGRMMENQELTSILDVGCGIGTWLRAASELGIKDLLGLDGNYIDLNTVLFDPALFQAADLNKPFRLTRRFDLTVCNEVAEHFPHERGPTFVRDLAATSDVIVFSAAIPFQGGDNHFNEQWPEYWAILFRKHGFVCFDPFRDLIWNDAGVESWYAQNVFLYIKEGNDLANKLKRYRADRKALSRVHPKIFLTNVTRYRPLASAALEAEIDDWQQLVDAYASGAIEVPPLRAIMSAQTGEDGAGKFPLSRMRYTDAAEIERQHSEKENKEREKDRQHKEVLDHLELKVGVLDTHGKALEGMNAKLSGDSAYKTAQIEILRLDRDQHAASSASLRQERDQHAAVSASLQQERDQQGAVSELLRQERDRLRNAFAEQTTQSELVRRDRDRLQNVVVHQAAVLADQAELLRHEREGLQRVLASRSAELETLQQQLNSLIASTSWQITRPFRAALRRMPGLARPLRRALKLAWWTITLQLIEKLRERHRRLVLEAPADQGGAAEQPPVLAPTPTVSIEPEVDYLESLGAFNAGWYGPNLLSIEDRYCPVHVPSERHHQIAKARYDAQSTGIVDKYYGGVVPGGERPYFIRFGPMEMVRAAIDNRSPRTDVSRSAAQPTYSIVTSYFRHVEFFRRCAASVAALMDGDFRASGEKRIEWVIVNDDPDIDESGLRELLPEGIRSDARVMSEFHDGKNRGVVAPLNQAIHVASNQWLLFLDCDDRIAANATLVLDHYIRKFDHCRYISSGMVDIDENDQYIRWRRHEHRSASMVEIGMVTGHLKAIRRDLFDEIGEFNLDYPGCQDFDLALRTSLVEPILLIPDYIYLYRWHQRSQSVDKIEQLFRVFNTIRKEHVRKLIDQKWPRPTSSRRRTDGLRQGICLVRTQGLRLEFLAECLRSIATQKIPTTPCLLVHADRVTFEMLERWVESVDLPVACIVLHASDLKRFRGYPLNVGIDYIAAHQDKFDFMCMLDDDDIQYPLFSERMVEALRMSGADVVVGLTNHRRPWTPPAAAYPLLPASSLVAGNFIPNNAYAVRVDSLLASGARFPEDMDYVEDWHFLLSLLLANLRFAQVWETVAEFRMTGDGNTVAKKNPDHYKACEDRVIAFGKAATRRRGLGTFYREIIEFNFDRREPLRDYEIDRLTEAHKMFQVQAAEIDATQPTAIDFAAAVPFHYCPGVPTKNPGLAVICHLFYEHQAPQFQRYLRNISFPFALHISTDTTAKKTAIEAAFAGWSHSPVEVRVVKNQGRDIAPKLLGFPEVYTGYEYVLHLHSKGSTHAPVLSPWRTYIFENLLGSKDVVNSVFDAFQRRPDLGMIGPQHIEPIREWVKWGENFEISDRLARRMGITLSPDRIIDFPSGSMFWARSAALKPLLDLGLTIDDFDPERGQTDRTLAHAIERLYYFVCERAGFRWMKICRPELVGPPAKTIDISEPQTLDGVLSEYRLDLVGAARSTTHGMLETPPA